MQLPLLPLQPRAGIGTSASVDAQGHPTATLALVLAGGVVGPQVSVTVETSDENVAWRPAGTAVVVAVAATGSRTIIRRSALSRYVRASWAVTPDGQAATFSLTGEGVQVLATREDINALGWVPAGLALFTDEAVDKALVAQSAVVVGYLNQVKGIVPPVLTWGGDVRWAVVQLAVYDLYCTKGMLDPIVTDRAAQAINWLKAVKNGDVFPAGLTGSAPTPGPDSGGVDEAWAYSEPDRGWGGSRGGYGGWG